MCSAQYTCWRPLQEVHLSTYMDLQDHTQFWHYVPWCHPWVWCLHLGFLSTPQTAVPFLMSFHLPFSLEYVVSRVCVAHFLTSLESHHTCCPDTSGCPISNSTVLFLLHEFSSYFQFIFLKVKAKHTTHLSSFMSIFFSHQKIGSLVCNLSEWL